MKRQRREMVKKEEMMPKEK
jgi:hypothetical protein